MRRRLFIVVPVVVVLAAALGAGAWAAFMSTTSSTDSFTAGTVYLTDNDAGTRALSLLSASGGDSASSCIAVTYVGTLAANVRLYGTVAGTIGPYLTLTVTRGTIASPSFPSCTGFTADATDYVGSGAGVIYSGALSSFPSSYATGLVDPTSGSPATWNQNDVHVYRLTATLGADPLSQGTTGSANFTWEARNT